MTTTENPIVRQSVPSEPIWYKELQLQINALVIEADNGNIMAVSILRRMFERLDDLGHQMGDILSTASNIRSSYSPGKESV